MLDLGEASLETFSGRLGERFRVSLTDELSVDISLAEATPIGLVESTQARAPFSIVFRGPAAPILAQRTYRIEHDELGVLDLFLVPLEPDAAGARYEAVFG